MLRKYRSMINSENRILDAADPLEILLTEQEKLREVIMVLT